MDIIYFSVTAIGVYFAADWILERIERIRGARFEQRQIAFFAIILPLALASFWLMRALSG